MRLVFMTPAPPNDMRAACRVFTAFLLLAASAAWLPPVSGHEQKTMVVIMVHDGAASGNISDPTFVQGNALYFRMEDATNNTTMEVRLDTNMDGAYNASEDFTSATLTESCELDENGSLVDASCAVSTTYVFESNASVGTYTFWIQRTTDGNATLYRHTVVLHEDVHVENTDGPTPGDCFGAGCDDPEETTENQASAEDEAARGGPFLGFALLALIGALATANSIRKERTSSQKTDSRLNEEE